MRFYQRQHAFYCGVDLHARKMFVSVVEDAGTLREQRNLDAGPEPFLSLLRPFREQLVVGCECMFAWYWLADLCRDEGIDFVLGHALYMKAIHGGKTKNDRIDSEKIARLLRGGMFPQAYAYPREMRATRDLLRRRSFLVRLRTESIGHVENTVSQYNLPAIDKKLRYADNRDGIAEQFVDPAARRMIESDLGRLWAERLTCGNKWDREPVDFSRTGVTVPEPVALDYVARRPPVFSSRRTLEGDVCKRPRPSERLTGTQRESLRARRFESAGYEAAEEILGRSATASPSSDDGGSRRSPEPVELFGALASPKSGGQVDAAIKNYPDPHDAPLRTRSRQATTRRGDHSNFNRCAFGAPT